MSPHNHRTWLVAPTSEGAWTATLPSFRAVSNPNQLQDATGSPSQPESLASIHVQHQSTASNLTDCEAKPVALPTSRNNHWPHQISDHSLRLRPTVKPFLYPLLSMDSRQRDHQAGEHNLKFHPTRSYCRAQPVTLTVLEFNQWHHLTTEHSLKSHPTRGDCRDQQVHP